MRTMKLHSYSPTANPRGVDAIEILNHYIRSHHLGYLQLVLLFADYSEDLLDCSAIIDDNRNEWRTLIQVCQRFRISR